MYDGWGGSVFKAKIWNVKSQQCLLMVTDIGGSPDSLDLSVSSLPIDIKRMASGLDGLASHSGTGFH